MKHLLLTIIAAVVLVGCGPTKAEQSLIDAAESGNIEAVKQHLAADTDVKAKADNGFPPLHLAADRGHSRRWQAEFCSGFSANSDSSKSCVYLP